MHIRKIQCNALNANQKWLIALAVLKLIIA